MSKASDDKLSDDNFTDVEPRATDNNSSFAEVRSHISGLKADNKTMRNLLNKLIQRVNDILPPNDKQDDGREPESDNSRKSRENISIRDDVKRMEAAVNMLNAKLSELSESLNKDQNNRTDSGDLNVSKSKDKIDDNVKEGNMNVAGDKSIKSSEPESLDKSNQSEPSDKSNVVVVNTGSKPFGESKPDYGFSRKFNLTEIARNSATGKNSPQ